MGQETFREGKPITFYGHSGCLVIRPGPDEPPVGWPGLINGSTPIRWLFGNNNDCSLVSLDAVSRAGLLSHPSYRRLDSRDNVEVRDNYTENLLDNVIAVIKLPMDLQNGVNGQMEHFCFVADGLPIDLVLGVSLLPEQGFQSFRFSNGTVSFQ